MSQDNIIKLVSKECKQDVYWTRKNRKTVERKIELRKFCKHLGRHTVFTERGKK
ncbi:MAG: 50S ribosomal protein L33 [Candidatus Spechtbacteria bacterium SB0662_bin_43]|uniref:Large ribosomal subunit protein bL33 n=1 Tax=Candidatus Spechtbacteria bacterium SB0662_bin_43 TaxID=2604897 RepID=A0A845DAP1_9BACT|nr:50S ribosomal protein L33 [Candidatus Spechtbacteria bacterium SB0662_bin_43]